MNLCVFLGSNFGKKPAYRAAAVAVGAEAARRGWTIVYGGSNKGMMGAVADAALDQGGRVVGVIPRKFEELGAAHARLTELHVVETMHERKALMAEKSDAFLALPGGIGTWEEILEAVTWTQIGYHAKRAGFLNIEGYYDPLLAQFHRSVEEGFLLERALRIVAFGSEIPAMLDTLSQGPVAVPDNKWFNA